MPSLARQSRLTPSSHGRRHFGTTTAGTQAPAVSLAPAPPRSGGTPSLPACAGPTARVGLRYRAKLPGTLACSEPPRHRPPLGGNPKHPCTVARDSSPNLRCVALSSTPPSSCSPRQLQLARVPSRHTHPRAFGPGDSPPTPQGGGLPVGLSRLGAPRKLGWPSPRHASPVRFFAWHT